jgi:hypothetical protein
MQKSRNLFQTLTFKGISIGYVSLLAVVIASIAPEIESLINRRVQLHQKEDVADVFKIILTVTGFFGGTAGAGTAIAGRINAGGVHTPKYLPGPNNPNG